MFAESPAQPASNMQIAEHKEAAIRGLSNYMFMEAQRMAKVCIRSLPLYACEPKALACLLHRQFADCLCHAGGLW